jgi:hypothetical protein
MFEKPASREKQGATDTQWREAGKLTMIGAYHEYFV